MLQSVIGNFFKSIIGTILITSQAKRKTKYESKFFRCCYIYTVELEEWQKQSQEQVRQDCSFPEEVTEKEDNLAVKKNKQNV